MIRPAGKKDVTVTIAGLDFNTPDNFVLDYINKFGIVMSTAVNKFDTGPFKGKCNGERKYQVDFSKATRQMGTFHLIDGCKVKIFYRGNKKTCGRCHKSAADCSGDAVAKNCALGGGAREFLSDHIKKLWTEIGFAPTSFELDDSDKTEDDMQQAVKDAPKINETRFPPTIKKQDHSIRDIENNDVITIRNLPKHLEDKEIIMFLTNSGMPIDHEDKYIAVNRGEKNAWVIISELCPANVKEMYNSIHFHETNKKFFDVPLYCKALRNMTPVKKDENDDRRNSIPAIPPSADIPTKTTGDDCVETTVKPTLSNNNTR